MLIRKKFNSIGLKLTILIIKNVQLKTELSRNADKFLKRIDIQKINIVRLKY